VKAGGAITGAWLLCGAQVPHQVVWVGCLVEYLSVWLYSLSG